MRCRRSTISAAGTSRRHAACSARLPPWRRRSNSMSNTLLSALLAEDGFSGPDAPLEGERGFLRVTASQPSWRALTHELGHEWELLKNTYKPYPCGVVLNPVIEACLDLRRDARWSLDDIEQIELTRS